MKLKVLHITSWYPNEENDREAPWIKNHVDALNSLVDNHVLHLEVRTGKLHFNKSSDAPNHCRFRLKLPVKQWFIIEAINFLLLWYFLKSKYNAKNYDIVNFHIAYPQLTYIKYIRHLLPKHVFITEHWSAYHLNFGVKKRLARVENIFKQNFKLITVSKALGEDIRCFSRHPKLEYRVIPNVVNTNIFYHDNSQEKEDVLFMVSAWKAPKDPFTIIKAFSNLLASFPTFKLAIGGYGDQWEDMQKLVNELSITDHIIWLGKLQPTEIAGWQRKSRLFLHCSAYETFSVVVAEALCCGTPVIASSVGGINELLDVDNGLRVQRNRVKNWQTAIDKAINTRYDYKAITKNASSIFSQEAVGLQYANVLSSGKICIPKRNVLSALRN